MVRHSLPELVRLDILEPFKYGSSPWSTLVRCRPMQVLSNACASAIITIGFLLLVKIAVS